MEFPLPQILFSPSFHSRPFNDDNDDDNDLFYGVKGLNERGKKNEELKKGKNMFSYAGAINP